MARTTHTTAKSGGIAITPNRMHGIFPNYSKVDLLFVAQI